tara:strand:- start:158 stop:1633 length:1476 start_codon:yes stop_codon:yes gene_type:complete
MKKIITLIIALSMTLVSCDNDFNDLNVDPTASTNLDLNPKFAYLFLKSAAEEVELSYTSILCNGQLVQQVIDQQFPQSSIYTNREDLQSAWWITQYTTTIKTVVDIINQLEAEGNVGTEMGIARMWKVFIFHVLVDQYGDTPYFQAGRGFLDGVVRPVYDDDQVIYMDMLNELEQAVAQIGGSSTLGSSDLVFNGDTSKWKKFGNSLMLRLAMRIKNVDPTGSNTWAQKAIDGGTMSSNEDTAFMTHTDGPTDLNRNAWGTYQPRYSFARIGATLYDWLESNGDPRLNILADPNGPAAGNRYGLENDQLLAIYGESPESYARVNSAITQLNSPWIFLSYAQTALLEAELAAAAGDHTSAEAKYNSGVRAHMQIWGSHYDASLTVDDATVDAYLLANPYNSAEADKMIGEQYWAASFFDFFEGFSNFRRSGYPTLQPFGGHDPHPSNTTNGAIPRRLLYPSSEGSVNADNFQAVLQAQGPNDQVTRVWWDVN